jgi:two-component system chemotaxis response regulator CheB
MARRPMPVVMVSSLTEVGATETLKALELGAVDYVTKPMRDIEQAMKKISAEICEKVKIAAVAKIKTPDISEKKVSHEILSTSNTKVNNANKYVLIGASTGGVDAISKIINALPPTCPPVLIAQHMPEKFTTSFAARLDKSSQLTVYEATDGMQLKPGHVYLAPGAYHLGVRKSNGTFVTHLNDGPQVSGHKPSVDYLFSSAASTIPGKNIIAFILTGMGKDGAQGLKQLKDLGAKTYGQSEASCVVYGMPRAAKELGSIEKELNLNEIAINIMQFCI